MAREGVRSTLKLCTALVWLPTLVCVVAHAESFDRPVQHKIVDFGHSRYLMPNDNRHVKLRCSYYPKFMIKELNDPGLKGASISIVPGRAGSITACSRRRVFGEKAFDWPGYYGGVKGGLVFLVDADDTDGLGFGVFDPKTGEKVFEDVLTPFQGEPNDQLRFGSDSYTQLTVRYLRVVTGDCSLPKDGTACWSKLMARAGLKLTPMPSCDYHGEDAKDPSVIVYLVELSLSPKPSIRTLANPTRCRPAE